MPIKLNQHKCGKCSLMKEILLTTQSGPGTEISVWQMDIGAVLDSTYICLFLFKNRLFVLRKGQAVCPSKRAGCLFDDQKEHKQAVYPSKWESCLLRSMDNLYVIQKGEAICLSKRASCLSLEKNRLCCPHEGLTVCLSEGASCLSLKNGKLFVSQRGQAVCPL